MSVARILSPAWKRGMDKDFHDFVKSVLMLGTAIAIAVFLPLAIDDGRWRVFLLLVCGFIIMAAYVEQAACHGRHCRKHGGAKK